MPTIFDICTPREDVAHGRMRDEEFAADLAKVANGNATPEYADPAIFFRHTHPTRGLQTLLQTVCKRLSAAGGEMNSVVRLDTQFGGGKTHALIGLIHAVQGMQGVQNADEFVDPSLLPDGDVRVAGLDGENADPANGVRLEGDLLAKSLWGEMAYRLAGRDGYERVRESDEKHIAPGTDTIVELFGGKPALILIDEIAVYLRKVAQVFPDAVNQFSAFTQSLLKAVAATPQVALVFTLAIRADDKEARDAYREEQQLAMAAFEEAESVAGRKSTQLNPTSEDETVHVLKRRLFEDVDDAKAQQVIEEYRDLWVRNEQSLHEDARNAETIAQFQKGYPLHPETLAVLVEKTSSLATFQRTRGMLRLLARTVHRLWEARPGDATAIHPHHIDPGVNAIRDEITTRLNQGAYTPALAADVAAVEGSQPSVAQQIDRDEHPGQPPVTSYLARTIFLHTLAYGDAAKGILPERLRFSVCAPAIDPSFVESARKRFVEESSYLDDRPGAPLRFMTEPNLTQMIYKATSEVESADVRAHLQERVRELFDGKGQPFEPVFFPGGPYEIPDEIGDGKPYIVVLHYEASAVSAEPTALPEDIVRMATSAGANEEYRTFLNNVLFVVADERLREKMKQAVRRRLGLKRLQEPDRIRELADYQQEKVKEYYRGSELNVAIAVLQSYRHLFFPSNNALGSDKAKLAHTAVDLPSTSEHPGNGQKFIKRALRDQKKILERGDAPDAPAFVRDQTPLRTKGEISTIELRNEFRRSPSLSILLDEEPLTRCIRDGIDHEVFIYRQGDQLWGKGDPAPSIRFAEDVFIHTMSHAEQQGLWPRQPKPEEETPTRSSGDGPGAGGGGAAAGGGDEGGAPAGGATGTAGGGGPATATPPSSLTAEGPLNQALTELFEAARSRKIRRVKEVRMRLFEAKAAWNVHQAVATYRDAAVGCTFRVGIEAEGIEQLELSFTGTLQKANAIKSFLDAQLRTATDQQFEGQYHLTLSTPLETDESHVEAFIKAMTKYGGGAAYVEAQAASEDAS